jgi:hypothetical protein
MTAPANYNDTLGFIVNGEPVEASIANRTAQQLKQNTDYLKNIVDNLTTTDEHVIAINRTVNSSTIVGTPVYYNSVTAQFDPAQAIAGKDAVVGIVLSKASPTVADLLLVGVGNINITGVLETGQTLSAARFYLSEVEAGKLTKVAESMFCLYRYYKEPKAHRVRKAHKELRAHKVHKVLKAPRALKARREPKEPKAHRVL